MTVALMYSGGLDSFIAYHYGRSKGLDIQPIFVDYEQPYAYAERAAVSGLYFSVPAVSVRIKDLWDLISKRMTNQIVPSRNVLLATIGAMVANRVWICALDGEQLGQEGDKSEFYFKTITSLLTHTNKFFTPKTIVETPFHNMSKAEAIYWLRNNKPSLVEVAIHMTTSCYEPNRLSKGCGNCLTCYKRYTAFKINGLETHTLYDSHPLKSAYALEIQREIPLAIQSRDYSRFTKKRIIEHQYLMKIIGDKNV